MKKRRYAIVTAAIIFALLIIIYPAIGGIVSQGLQKERIEIKAGEEGGVKITMAHISDLHIPKNGVTLEKLRESIEQINPDMIFLTGDIIDSSANESDINKLRPFLSFISQKASCFAVSGNHEKINPYYHKLKELYAKNNIKFLDGQASAATCKGKSLTIVGISDNGRYDTNETQGLSLAHEPIILLAHRPEYWKEYIGGSRPPLLTLSGHAHGGQFKLFGIGIYSPNQGFFPKYYDGLYACGDKYMAVSRGLGNSIFPLRLYNRYHLPVIELYI
ncbi:MAG: metallophosphoesterase [Christensenellales bacterium]|jgi:predicted MPP superfamily phosphohydrolase|nr:hypothetical protein [Clostridiales bacterium]